VGLDNDGRHRRYLHLLGTSKEILINIHQISPTIWASVHSTFARAASGIEVLRTPYRAPRANAVCERFLGNIRRECLAYFVILNERHVHRLVKEYKGYFNYARPHQGIEQRLPCRTERLDAPPVTETLSSRPGLNGLHHDYSWLAARSVEQDQTQCATHQ
jgi:transposase InsO family protein